MANPLKILFFIGYKRQTRTIDTGILSQSQDFLWFLIFLPEVVFGFAIIRKSVDHELGSPIFGPRSLILTHSDGSLFTVTNSFQSIGADTQVDEEIFD